MSLETRTKQFKGRSREEFSDFMSCMLRWLPEERWTARKLLQHPWLQGID
jgi:serine/threonine protein kinase